MLKQSSVDKSILGIASTKMKPDEYYRRTGQLLKKTAPTPGKAPAKKLDKKAVDQLAGKLRDENDLESFFQKCAAAGYHTDVAVNALISNMPPGRARVCTTRDIVDGDPYTTLAICMLDK